MASTRSKRSATNTTQEHSTPSKVLKNNVLESAATARDKETKKGLLLHKKKGRGYRQHGVKMEAVLMYVAKA